MTNDQLRQDALDEAAFRTFVDSSQYASAATYLSYLLRRRSESVFSQLPSLADEGDAKMLYRALMAQKQLIDETLMHLDNRLLLADRQVVVATPPRPVTVEQERPEPQAMPAPEAARITTASKRDTMRRVRPDSIAAVLMLHLLKKSGEYPDGKPLVPDVATALGWTAAQVYSAVSNSKPWSWFEIEPTAYKKPGIIKLTKFGVETAERLQASLHTGEAIYVSAA